ncbi:MAG: MFS transporter [Clostridia bacterium]|nr:MFS transporter [Clostridia bacterium]
MSIKTNYKATLFSCFSGTVTQAIVVNFFPLLFLTFCASYNISLEKVTILVTVNFLLQLLTDLVSTKLISKIGHRTGIVTANLLAAVGLILLCFLPELIDPYTALVICIVLCAIGSGLEEVLISPIVEACPTKRKSAIMSLTHSFYCWGTAAVIGLSTLFFVVVGLDKWRYLSLLWAIIPVLNLICFALVPIYNEQEENNGGSVKALFKNKTFWVFVVLMICSGAAEQAMGQWASAFAETALGVNKTLGDLAGPLMFAVMMGISRMLYALLSKKMNLRAFMIVSAILSVATYLVAVLSPFAWLGLVACALCGFAVGIMWPGTLSMTAGKIHGGTLMFAILALSGDIGCSLGPTVVGLVSGAFNDDLKKGLLFAIIFPIALLVGVLFLKKKKPKIQNEEK